MMTMAKSEFGPIDSTTKKKRALLSSLYFLSFYCISIVFNRIRFLPITNWKCGKRNRTSHADRPYLVINSELTGLGQRMSIDFDIDCDQNDEDNNYIKDLIIPLGPHSSLTAAAGLSQHTRSRPLSCAVCKLSVFPFVFCTNQNSTIFCRYAGTRARQFA